MTIEFDELEKPNLAILRGRLDCLEQIVEALLLQMPETAMKIVVAQTKSFVQDAETDARETGSDLRRDYASGAYEVYENIDWRVDAQTYYLKEGAVIRTVQPAPAPED